MHVSQPFQSPASPSSHPPFRYLERITPVVFPESAEVPETDLHFRLRVLLHQLLRSALGSDVFVGSDQFLYWDASDPKLCVAPDVYVRVAPQREPVRSWKVWQRGAPDVAVEVISFRDAGGVAWHDKLESYRHIGVRELLRFDPEDPERVLRIWDRVEGALVEREVTSALARSSVLGLSWAVAPADDLPVALRVATGSTLTDLVPTAAEGLRSAEQARLAAEQARRTAEDERFAAEQGRREEEAARVAAEQRVRELEAELKRRGG